jgi:hypothetical protein
MKLSTLSTHTLRLMLDSAVNCLGEPDDWSNTSLVIIQGEALPDYKSTLELISDVAKELASRY